MRKFARCLFAVILAIFLAQGLVFAEEITLTTIVPSGGSGSFPAPDFDSDWVSTPGVGSPGATGSSVTLNFQTDNKKGKRSFSGTESTDKMLVYVQCRNGTVISNRYYTGTWAMTGLGIPSGVGWGTYYTDLTSTSITINKVQSFYYVVVDAVRVYIWYWGT